MELLNQILLNNNFKLFLLIIVILTIITMAPPITNFIYNFYNNIIGKILMLYLIIFYSNTNDDMSHKLALVLTILYILLLINTHTQTKISNYGQDLHKNLYGGEPTMKLNMNEDDEVNEDTNYMGGNAEEQEQDLESTEEENMNIDSKIENIIQEEIVLNRKTYKDKLKEQRKLGVKQYKINEKRKNIMESLEKQAKEYKNVETEYNKIMEQVDKYDTNNDGIVDHNDETPEEIYSEMENIEEEMQQLEKQFEETLNKIKPEQDKFNSIVSSEKTATKGGSITIEGYSNNLYSVPKF